MAFSANFGFLWQRVECNSCNLTWKEWREGGREGGGWRQAEYQQYIIHDQSIVASILLLTLQDMNIHISKLTQTCLPANRACNMYNYICTCTACKHAHSRPIYICTASGDHIWGWILLHKQGMPYILDTQKARWISLLPSISHTQNVLTLQCKRAFHSRLWNMTTENTPPPVHHNYRYTMSHYMRSLSIDAYYTDTLYYILCGFQKSIMVGQLSIHFNFTRKRTEVKVVVAGISNITTCMCKGGSAGRQH